MRTYPEFQGKYICFAGGTRKQINEVIRQTDDNEYDQIRCELILLGLKNHNDGDYYSTGGRGSPTARKLHIIRLEIEAEQEALRNLKPIKQ